MRPTIQQEIRQLRRKFSTVEDPPCLDPEDISALGRMMKAIAKKLKTPFWKVLCHVSFICRKDKMMRAQSKSASAFEDCLDIRKLVD